jgi:hypothetical protein
MKKLLFIAILPLMFACSKEEVNPIAKKTGEKTMTYIVENKLNTLLRVKISYYDTSTDKDIFVVTDTLFTKGFFKKTMKVETKFADIRIMINQTQKQIPDHIKFTLDTYSTGTAYDNYYKNHYDGENTSYGWGVGTSYFNL